MSEDKPITIDIDNPRYDQEKYWGRVKHFILTTNPLNVLATSKQLEDAKCLITKYRLKHPLPPGTTEEDIWRAKVLYDSAFHPDTGEKMALLGRMSFQVPGNMTITGGMLAFYKSTVGVLFWHWMNQSFNAIVNHTNRSGNLAFTDKQLLTSYVLATGGAVATALSLNHLLRNAPHLIGRLVPLTAIIIANFINIPIMRMQELQHGTPVYDAKGNQLGHSTVAAQHGILQVILSRVMMPVPSSGLTPVLMNYLEKKGYLAKYPWINLPANVAFAGFSITFATPLCCAIFKQKAHIAVRKLEPELKESIEKRYSGRPPELVYYNKGL